MSKQASAIRFCPHCGHATEHFIPVGDNRVRAVCPACHIIQYQNPINVVGTLPFWEDQVLLCKRNIEPRKGTWTLPAGFLEMEETSSEGAARETLEESGAQFQMGTLFALINVLKANQIHFFYLAKLTSTSFAPGIETTQARLFTQQEIPWDQLAFRTTHAALHAYFHDVQSHQLGKTVHIIDII